MMPNKLLQCSKMLFVTETKIHDASKFSILQFSTRFAQLNVQALNSFQN
uniref:Uncharacterized protein n=1 Tax=Arundo donax TaxID=35708 RepID=A0A0A9D6B2_ARUDO